MVTRLKVWNSFLCGVFVTAFFVYVGLFNTETGCLKHCIFNKHSLRSDHRTKSKISEREKSETSDLEQDGDFRVYHSTSNVKRLSKIGETRLPNCSDNASRKQGDANTRSRLGSAYLSDYVKYPCLPGSNQSERLRRLDRCIRTVNVQLVADTVKSVECVKLKVEPSIPICIHDPRIDVFVSGSIFATGGWEKELLRVFVEALKKVKEIVVLDIGCNIGLYTLVAAREGKHVVSIDANVQNLRLLSKSLTLGHLRENATIVWNALSDTYRNVSLKTNQFNVGGFSVNTDTKSLTGNNVIIETILLDDLMYLFENKPVGIKMDVESHELHVLKGGVTFLKNIDVRFIQMEFVLHRERESGQSIVAILRYNGFAPFANCLGDKRLVDLPLKDWPIDVCFIKNI